MLARAGGAATAAAAIATHPRSLARDVLFCMAKKSLRLDGQDQDNHEQGP